MRILALPGDGIGPEITTATLAVLADLAEVTGTTIDVDTREIGLASLAAQGTTLPDAVLEAIHTYDGTILGPVSHYDYPSREEGGVNPSAALRTTFGLHANIRPCRSVEGLTVLRAPMDLVIVREGTEGFYADRNMYAGCGEFMPDEDTAFAIRKITAGASQRVARAAFELATTRRRRVTAIHKANVLKLSDGLFLRAVREVAQDFPDVAYDELIVDAAAARLVRSPDAFDVVVTTNMFGDILSDLASELCGSLGLGGAVNQGDDVCVAQAQHGSAPDIAGQGVANPTSLILSAGMLLRWFGERTGAASYAAAADLLEESVGELLVAPAPGRATWAGPWGRPTSPPPCPTASARVTSPGRGRHRCLTSPPHPACSSPPTSSSLRPRQRRRHDPLRGQVDCATNRVTTGQTQFAEGTGLPLHSHNVEESVLVLEGEAVAEIGEESFDLVAGQATWVPAGVPHRFLNRGRGTMRIYWVYGGRDVTRTITATGETFEHLSDSDRGGLGTP